MAEEFKCNFCEKTSHSSPGLKGHITKMHKDKNIKYGKTVANKRKPDEGFDRDIGNLLEEEVIQIPDDEDKSLEESYKMEIEKNEKKYNNKCDDCGFEFETVRKYLLVQELLKHKESCKDKTNDPIIYYQKHHALNVIIR